MGSSPIHSSQFYAVVDVGFPILTFNQGHAGSIPVHSTVGTIGFQLVKGPNTVGALRVAGQGFSRCRTFSKNPTYHNGLLAQW